MAQITAALVKELRERTSSGMMECKKALQETDGDIDAAVAHLRKSGQAKAEKKAGRTAAEGLVSIKLAPDGRKVAMVEVNSETDFVAKNDAFVQFVGAVAETVLTHEPADLSALAALPLDRGKSVEEVRMGLIAEIGENINVRRFSLVTTSAGVIAHYLHGSRIGVMVELDGGDAELAKDIAMHVAASNPVCISSADVPADLLAKERAIYSAQAADSGKPPEIVAKMVDGRISKYLKEVTLAGQPFVKDPDQTVEKLLTAKAARVVRFERYELGEGIEKKQENFAEEVIAQARGD